MAERVINAGRLAGGRTAVSQEIEAPVRWEPRRYKRRAWTALTGGQIRRAVLVWHRRAGKDLLLLNATIVASMRRTGVYWHIFPTAKQGRKILWDGVTKEGRPFLDHWPRELISHRNEADMRVKLTGGSVWQVVGSDNFHEALIGGNPVGIVFSEYALQNPCCWEYLRPILAENEGWAAFAFTPRGSNHGEALYEMALRNPNWFCERLSVEDTHAIPLSAIDEEHAAGMPDELIRQEFYCSFAAALVGSYYGKLMEVGHQEGRLTLVPHVSHQGVETWWDLGVSDATAIWFVQRAGTELHIVDYYEASGEGLDHYAEVLRNKGYRYERHVLPHDVAVRELGTGRSRIETLRSLGVVTASARSYIAPQMPLADGINAVRTVLPRCWFDAGKCERGIAALKQYQRRWNDNRRAFEDQPLHDWTSHAADAFRYGALTVKDGSRRPDPPIGWTMPQTPMSGTVVWPPWEWGAPEYPRTIEIHDDPDSPY
jgi:phage terminase large subunit